MTDDADTASEGLPPSALTRAARHLLRPLVRLLVTHGGTHPFLASLLKDVYLEVAVEELEKSGERVTASRISLLSGLHRKDIKRLREAGEARYAPPASVSLGARLVARWTGDPAFTGADGAPLPLPRQAESGPSFETLVASVSTDIRPRAVLDEWLRLGLVEVDAGDHVRLVTDAFVPREGFDEKAHYLGRNVHDHLAAAVHNVSGGEPMFERGVYYEGLSERSVDELAALAEELGMEALRRVNRRALALQRRDASEAASETNQRIHFGAFFYHAESGRDDDGESG